MLQTFWANDANRLGLDVPSTTPITNANDGQENFYFFIDPAFTPGGNAVPEASSLVAWGLCAAVGAIVAYRRRRAR
jgi:hypothetical protein